MIRSKFQTQRQDINKIDENLSHSSLHDATITYIDLQAIIDQRFVEDTQQRSIAKLSALGIIISLSVLASILGCSVTAQRSINSSSIRPIAEGERLFYARYNPCSCDVSGARFSIEISEVTSDALKSIAGSETTSRVASEVALSDIPAREASRGVKLDIEQSAKLAALLQRESALPRRWERVEVIGEAAQAKRVVSVSPVSDDGASTSTLPELSAAIGQSQDVISVEVSPTSQWKTLWSWWSSAQGRTVIVKARISGVSALLSGHLLRRAEPLMVISALPDAE